MPNNHPTNKNLSKVDFSFSDLHKQKGENPEHFSNCGEAKRNQRKADNVCA